MSIRGYIFMLYGYVVMGWPDSDSDSDPGRFEKDKDAAGRNSI